MSQNDINEKNLQKIELDVYIGNFLNNRYLIKDVIGKGGMGKVYLAEDSAKGNIPVAVKLLSMNLVNQQMSQRFAREIFIGAQLGRKSTHIVRVLSYGVTEDKVPFYVMEYLQGKNLKSILKIEPLDLPTFLSVCHQICLGLQCAHQGVSLKGEIYPIVHRDIKPENIFLSEDTKENKIVKILDFGIAKFLSERSGMTITESFIGSLPYCSPEHMEGRKLLDVRSDIYSLGVLMFEMLTGKHPFQIKSHSFGDWYQAHRFETPPAFEEVAPQVKVPQELKNLVIGCLAKEVSNRPQNVNQILVTLEYIQRQQDRDFAVSSNIYLNKELVQLVPVTSWSEKLCLQKKWPKNKPIASICFPHLLHTQQGSIPTFWAMLPQKEIARFLNKNNCVEFVFKKNLYPVVLWITVLSDAQVQLTRWLSYFLDLKDNQGYNLVHSLAALGYYHLLFFTLEEPNHCNNVITLSLNAVQRQQLLDYLEIRYKPDSVISFSESKAILKTEYENMKSEIMQSLAEQNKQGELVGKTWFNKWVDIFLNLFSHYSNKNS
ncbi:serine/threonine-protein kinase [Chlorogloeopsis sp. ULAP01]|uniref:serine/threonine protein kinase n=1 Tax=Chlorogloeopsis sp. ULAP01 TaxID=3056483 RepID=UPI0025AA8AE6|nr:serine/threonine-protein kinase [Chlorogloeopsis sp. ULAP01]MDM9379492.1 serine/threonine-protein kinase [Chlorogloeopsis sp. ULAP01]